jgi:hypothetical protein
LPGDKLRQWHGASGHYPPSPMLVENVIAREVPIRTE